MTRQDIDEEIKWLYKVKEELKEQEISDMKKNVGKYCKEKLWNGIGMIIAISDSGRVTYRNISCGKGCYDDMYIRTTEKEISYDFIDIIDEE